jgi:hypothetical protein
MERNRRLQVERRSQVDNLQQESRALQEKAKDLRRGVKGDAGVQSQQQQQQQGAQRVQQQQVQGPSSPVRLQLGLRQGGGMVSNFSPSPEPPAALPAVKRSHSSLEKSSKASPRVAPLSPSRTMNGLRLRMSARQR